MIGYAATELFTQRELELRSHAAELVEAVVDPDVEVRCHELARAVGRALRERAGDAAFVLEDGHFGIVEHSWLRLSKRTILDVYVPGALPMVQLIDCSALLPSARNYKRGETRRDIDEAMIAKLIRGWEGRGAGRRQKDSGCRTKRNTAT